MLQSNGEGTSARYCLAHMDPYRITLSRFVMTPAEFKEARHKLGLSANRCARLFRIGSGRTIRRWEAGTQDIPGPAQVLMKALRDRHLPKLPA